MQWFACKTWLGKTGHLQGGGYPMPKMTIGTKITFVSPKRFAEVGVSPRLSRLPGIRQSLRYHTMNRFHSGVSIARSDRRGRSGSFTACRLHQSAQLTGFSFDSINVSCARSL